MTAPSERYVVIGLARPRTAWFAELGRWATSAVVPMEYVKAVGVDEVRARLESGRRFSALIIESSVPGLDRDLVAAAVERATAVFVVDDKRVERDWMALGAAAVLAPEFDRTQLLAALELHATGVGRYHGANADSSTGPDERAEAFTGRLVAVTGTGGAGASTAAMALAQVAGRDVRHSGSVLLADLALHADQAVLHDSRDVMPGVPELVEAHRSGALPADEVRRLAFTIEGRGHDLLLGLRRHRDWTGLRPRALAAALDGLQHAYGLVVADTDADVEGERQCGSIDVEERNMLSRETLSRADAVLVVTQPSTIGIHRLLGIVIDLTEFGVSPERIAPVITRAPRSAGRRAELTEAVGKLAVAATGSSVGPFSGPVFLPHRRRVEHALRDATPLPSEVGRPLLAAFETILESSGPNGLAQREPEPVSPGSLGSDSGQND